MTARKENDLRSLIEEAVSLIHAHPAEGETAHIQAYWKLKEALSLLPEWQEFDSEKDATWPQKDGDYLIQLRDGNDARVDYWESKISGWLECFDEDVLAYQPLPKPYVKP